MGTVKIQFSVKANSHLQEATSRKGWFRRQVLKWRASKHFGHHYSFQLLPREKNEYSKNHPSSNTSLSQYSSTLSSQASFQQFLLSIKATLSKPSARKLPKSSWKVFSHSYHCFPQLRCVTQSSLSCLSMCHHPLPPYIPEPDFYLTKAGKVVMENKSQLQPHLAFLRQVKFCKI